MEEEKCLFKEDHRLHLGVYEQNIASRKRKGRNSQCLSVP